MGLKFKVYNLNFLPYRAYQQLPRRACARCGNGIGSQELIMRAKDLVYHLNCFVCVVCLRILNKGTIAKQRNVQRISQFPSHRWPLWNAKLCSVLPKTLWDGSGWKLGLPSSPFGPRQSSSPPQSWKPSTPQPDSEPSPPLPHALL